MHASGRARRILHAADPTGIGFAASAALAAMLSAQRDEGLDVHLVLPVRLGPEATLLERCHVDREAPARSIDALRHRFRRMARDVDAIHVHGCAPFNAAIVRDAKSGDVPLVLSPWGWSRRPVGRLRAWLRRRRVAAMLQGVSAVHVHDESERAACPAAANVAHLSWLMLPTARASGPAMEKPLRGRYPVLRERPIVLLDADDLEDGDVARVVRALAACHVPGAMLAAGTLRPARGAAIVELARREGVTDRLVLIDWAPGDRREALRGADLVAIPTSRWDCGHLALEAVAQGTPVVCSAGVATARWLEQQGAGAVVDDAPEAWTAALDVWLADPRRRRDRALDVADLIDRQHSAHAIGARWAHVYEQLSVRAPEYAPLLRPPAWPLVGRD